MTPVDARVRLRRLEEERRAAVEAGLSSNHAYMSDLLADIEAMRSADIGLAVTALATNRAALHGPQVG